MANVCMTNNCSDPRFAKGHCRPHALQFYSFVKKGLTSWAKLEKDGVVLASKNGGWAKKKAATVEANTGKVQAVIEIITKALAAGKAIDQLAAELVQTGVVEIIPPPDGMVMTGVEVEALPAPSGHDIGTVQKPVITNIEYNTPALDLTKTATVDDDGTIHFIVPPSPGVHLDVKQETVKVKAKKKAVKKPEPLTDDAVVEAAVFKGKEADAADSDWAAPSDKVKVEFVGQWVFGLKNSKTGELVRDAKGSTWQEAAQGIGWKPEDVIRYYPIKPVAIQP